MAFCPTRCYKLLKMGILVKYEDLTKISREFYSLFENKDGIDTPDKYKLREDLAKYVIEAKFSHDVAFNNCELTFKEWAIKQGYTSEKL